jgi:NADH dehydrogenase
MQKHKVLIVGGGFGGVKAALELCKQDDVSVTLVTDQPNFRYNPTLYHTATGGLRQQSSIPLEKLLDTGRVSLVVDTAEKIDRTAHTVTTKSGSSLPYDFLILALGSITNYFGIQGLREYSYGIKSVEEAMRFKQHLHQQLEAEHKPDLHYIIVGAGPTGIELAGALPEYLRRIMKAHGVKHKAIHIDLIEAAPRLLPRSPKKVSRAVRHHLRKLGVKLYLGQAVQGETADGLMVNGEPIPSHTVVWTAGMANNPFFAANNFTLAERGKVAVNEYLEAEENIYVIGDNASTRYSGMAQTALHDAKFVAADIARRAQHKARKTYKPKEPIYVFPAGPNWAAVQWGKIILAGRTGWLLREAADWIGFHDLEPWWKATDQWATDFGSQEECPTCSEYSVQN